MADTSKTDETKPLPVTAEIGGEGGSYADPVLQKATREGELPPSDDAVAEGSAPGTTAESAQAVPEGPEDGVRFPEHSGADRTGRRRR